MKWPTGQLSCLPLDHGLDWLHVGKDWKVFGLDGADQGCLDGSELVSSVLEDDLPLFFNRVTLGQVLVHLIAVVAMNKFLFEG